jgi:hypothetical protein
MNNTTTKTIAFAAVAAAILLITWKTRPSLPVGDDRDWLGSELLPIKNASDAGGMEIVQFDEQKGQPKTFKVAQVKGVWSIPSHENYPADAKDQLAEAATALIGLKILDVVTDDPGDHAQYGVLDPAKSGSGATGVGMRVIMNDKQGNPLAGLIIGKQADKGKSPSSGPEHGPQYYVRKIENNEAQDRVCVVELKTDKLSTKFDEWIEKNLLKISSWDVRKLQIRDYSVDPVQGEIISGGDMSLSYEDTGDQKWKMVKDEAPDKTGHMAPRAMAPDEELNTENLDKLKNALDDVKIVDVRRKPAGLSGGLKAGKEFLGDREARNSLASRGFFPARIGGEWELFSNNGELRVATKDGVGYVLRFGAVSGVSEKAKPDKKDEKKKDDKKDEPAEPGMNRYMLVMAEFNPDMIAKPTLEPLPEEPAAKTEAKPEPKKDAPDAKTEKVPKEKGPSGEEGKPGDKGKTEAKVDDKTAKTEEKTKAEEKTGKTEEQAKAEEKTAKTEDKAKTEEKPAAEPKKEEAKTEAPKTEPAKKEEPKKEPEKKEEPKKDIKAERERIQKENQRKQDEYDKQLKEGRDKVQELNARFADWYYIIPEDAYRKVHLGRTDIVKKKEKKDEKAKDDKSKEADHGDAEKTKASPISDLEKATKEAPGK